VASDKDADDAIDKWNGAELTGCSVAVERADD